MRRYALAGKRNYMFPAAQLPMSQMNIQPFLAVMMVFFDVMVSVVNYSDEEVSFDVSLYDDETYNKK